MELLTLMIAAVGIFAATNVDDLFILGVFFADRALRPTHVIAGQYLGLTFLIAGSFVGSLVSMALPAPWIALLGIVPLALGIKKLRELGRRQETDAHPPSVGSTVLAVAGVTIANGGDNLGIYIPYFASLSVWETLLVVAVFMTMIAVWCIAAMWLMGHRRISRFVERFGHVMLPIVLVGLGLWVLSGALPLIFEIQRSIASVR